VIECETRKPAFCRLFLFGVLERWLRGLCVGDARWFAVEAGQTQSVDQRRVGSHRKATRAVIVGD
jgi:hypothetical protein